MQRSDSRNWEYGVVTFELTADEQPGPRERDMVWRCCQIRAGQLADEALVTPPEHAGAIRRMGPLEHWFRAFGVKYRLVLTIRASIMIDATRMLQAYTSTVVRKLQSGADDVASGI